MLAQDFDPPVEAVDDLHCCWWRLARGAEEAAARRRKSVTTRQQLDELAKIAASLVKTAEEQNRHIAAHDRQIASLLTAVESHDRQIASIIRALDKQRGVVNALAASVIAHDDQIEALGDRIDQFLNRLRPQ
jgi:septal ring factor EnvC (AmiA/AmiB activator)